MKRVWIGIVVIVLCLLFPFSSLASDSYSIEAGKDFSAFPKEEGVAQRLHISREELQDFCYRNNIVYLAADRRNTRQIRLSISSTEFSQSAGQLSGLTDEKIRALIPELTGENQGEIIKKGGQKFIFQEILLEDASGKYLLTQYITVAARKYYVLSFYTQSGTQTDYIEEVFAGFASPDFKQEEQEENSSILLAVFPVLIVHCPGRLVNHFRGLRGNLF